MIVFRKNQFVILLIHLSSMQLIAKCLYTSLPKIRKRLSKLDYYENNHHFIASWRSTMDFSRTFSKKFTIATTRLHLKRTTLGMSIVWLTTWSLIAWRARVDMFGLARIMTVMFKAIPSHKAMEVLDWWLLSWYVR